jgi:hypothetical protein
MAARDLEANGMVGDTGKIIIAAFIQIEPKILAI